MPVPVDPYNFTAGEIADADQVDERFALLYAALDGALDLENLAAALAEAVFAPGDLKAVARSAAPSGWLLCDGSAVSRTGANAALFAAIGTTYGAGNGTTTFNVPDLRGRVPVGVDGAAGRLTANDALGNSGGAEKVALVYTEIADHIHFPNATGQVTLGGPDGVLTAVGDTVTTDGSVAAGDPHNNMQPFQIVNWVVKL